MEIQKIRPGEAIKGSHLPFVIAKPTDLEERKGDLRTTPQQLLLNGNESIDGF